MSSVDDLGFDQVELDRVLARVRASLVGVSTPVSIGRFELEDRIGAGGMGVVYRARDPKLGRAVALKLVRPSIEARGLDQLLRREAQALAGTKHPNVLEVYDVGWSETSPGAPQRLFIAMEFVDGMSLAAWLANAQAVDAILGVFLQAGRGIAAAHDAGLVHGDVKPENVLVGADGRVRVADFGVARGVSRITASRGNTQLDPRDVNTLTNAPGLGTPAYMPPEQMTGAATRQSDQYAFCVALYEAFRGVRPFEAETWDALLARKRAGIDDPDRGRAPPHVVRVWQTGLQPDPRRRFESMDQLLEALCPARPRTRWWFAAMAAATATLGVAANPGGTPPGPCDDVELVSPLTVERSSAIEEAFVRGSPAFGPAAAATALTAVRDREAARADAMRGVCSDLRGGRMTQAEFDRRMACIEREARRNSATLDAWAATEHPAQVAGAVEAAAQLPEPQRCLQADPLATALSATDASPTWRALAKLDAALAGADLPRARQAGARALALATETGNDRLIAEATLGAATASSWPTTAPELDRLREAAYLAQASGWEEGALRAALILTEHCGQTASRFDEAERWLAFARAQVVRMGSPAAARARVHEGRALFAHTRGELDVARTEFEAALAGSHDLEPTARIKLHARFGWFLDDTGHTDEAHEHHLTAVALARQTLGARHPRTADVRSSLAVNRLRAGDIEGSLELQRVALADTRAALGADNPRVAKHLTNLGAATLRAGRFPEALLYMREALQLRRASKEDDPLAFAEALRRTAEAELVGGDQARGRAHAREAVVANEALFGADHLRTAASRIVLANALRNADDPKPAKHQAALAVASLDARYPEPHLDRAAAHYALGAALGDLGDHPHAVRELETALNLFAAIDAGTLRIETARFSLAIELYEAGQRDRALALATRAAQHLAEQMPDIPLAQTVETWVEEHAQR